MASSKTPSFPVRRRQFLVGSAATAIGALPLTGCGGGAGEPAGPHTAGPLGLTPPQGGPVAAPTPAPAQTSSLAVNPANQVKVSMPVGTETFYPVQFGRAFVPGEIANWPSVLLDGTVTQAQVDVKTRHADGSVKFAVVSLVIPQFNSGERTITFGNQPQQPDRTPLGVAQMLDSRFDFDAGIRLTFGQGDTTGQTVSARAMLQTLTDAALLAETQAGGVQSRYWTQGPICTTVILCDHLNKSYDMGSNATRAIRPMFHVQFWPTIGQYHVRHIIEVPDVTKLKDELGLTVQFTTGFAQPKVRLTQSNVNLYAGTWRTRAYWGGADRPRMNLKLDVAYLSAARVILNHDPSIVINAASVTSYAADFAKRTQDLQGYGYWQKGMPTTGGRPDIGMMPKWDFVAMYTGSADMHAIGERHAEMAGAWAFFFREGDPAKSMVPGVSGPGRLLSKLSRPGLFLYDNNGYMTSSALADRFKVDGTLSGTRDGWQHDHAHTPGMFWWQYLSTGQAFWHEKLMQLAAWSQFIPNPAPVYNTVGNGASTTHMVLNGVQTRGWGWQIRNRARAWWAALDGSGEKRLFEQSLGDAVAQRCGLYDVPGGMVDHPVRVAWNNRHKDWYTSGPVNPRPNALAYWEGKGAYTADQLRSSVGTEPPDDWGGAATGLWMQNFVTLSLYHTVELGFTQADPLAAWSARLAVALANSAEPRHLADYVFPQLKNNGGYYQTVEDIYDGYAHNADGASPPSMPADPSKGFAGAGAPNTFQVTMEGYGSIAAAAVASANSAPQQASAWTALMPWYRGSVYYNHDPRYAILPRR